MSAAFTAVTMDRETKSILLYVETCCVDHGGLLEGIRMNAEDISNLNKMQAAGLLTFGRVPAKLLNAFQRKVTHWCDLTPAGWAIAHELRRQRAEIKGAARSRVDAEIAEREAA